MVYFSQVVFVTAVDDAGDAGSDTVAEDLAFVVVFVAGPVLVATAVAVFVDLSAPFLLAIAPAVVE